MTKSAAVYSLKGGVGKTTIAVNLSYCLAALGGQRTLLWEIDAQGAASFLLDQEHRTAKARRVFTRDLDPDDMIEPTRWSGLDLLGADMSLRHIDRTLSELGKPKRLRKLLNGLAAQYDRIVLDCPPGLGELSDQLFRAVDIIVVPVPPTPLAVRSLDQVREHIDSAHGGKPILVPVFTMVDRRKRLHRDIVAEHPEWPVIPHASLIERMAVDRSPVAARHGNSVAALAIIDMWQAVERQLATEDRQAKPRRDKKVPRIPSKQAPPSRTP
ncbi:MAG: ParA family protein [Novosphingobium sp.]